MVSAAAVERALLQELLRVCSGLAPPEGRLADSVRAIHDCNRALWDLEDAVRKTDEAAEVASLKRRIDDANISRHRAVDAFDAYVARQIAPRQASDAHVVNSESFGEMVDRGSILALKHSVLPAGPQRDHVRCRWDHLMGCLARCVEAAGEGAVRLVPRREVKLYGRGRAPTADVPEPEGGS